MTKARFGCDYYRNVKEGTELQVTSLSELQSGIMRQRKHVMMLFCRLHISKAVQIGKLNQFAISYFILSHSSSGPIYFLLFLKDLQSWKLRWEKQSRKSQHSQAIHSQKTKSDLHSVEAARCDYYQRPLKEKFWQNHGMCFAKQNVFFFYFPPYDYFISFLTTIGFGDITEIQKRLLNK